MLESLWTDTPIQRSYYRIASFAATCAGFWPTATRSSLKVIWFLISFCVAMLGGVAGIIYGFRNLNDLLSALDAFCPAITNLLSGYKMSTFHIYHKRFEWFIREMQSMIMADPLPAKQRIIQRYSSTANIFIFLVFVLGHTTNTLFSLQPPLVDAYRWWYGKPPLRLLPFKLSLPSKMLDLPYYPFTYVLNTMSGSMTVMGFVGADGFFLSSCYYFAALFHELQFDIRALFADLSHCEYSNAEQNRMYRHRLGELVVRHNRIMDLCDEFTVLFRAIVFMHFVSAALILCLSTLDLMLNTASMSAVIYAAYSIAAGSQYLLYCTGGSKVEDSSLEVADTLYDIDWYKCDLSTRKMIHIMLHRSQRAKIIDVEFFTPSLTSFSSLITKTGSYIALLKTFL